MQAVMPMPADKLVDHQTSGSGSGKEKKKSRRKWMNKLRNELRMPGAPPQEPAQSPQIPVPQMISESERLDWSMDRALICK
ncbi:hypothetical protein ACE3MZ_10075 [Paenibacillus sp. WLX1005]|uniref:hypothetical protein n=1 Tax=Paenibacillus sp. WLX1005 TaxID=3243766 RepID=UPI003983F43C